MDIFSEEALIRKEKAGILDARNNQKFALASGSASERCELFPVLKITFSVPVGPNFLEDLSPFR